MKVFILITFYLCVVQAHNIGIIGTGYVGLVAACGFAELGNKVKCYDINQEKIKQLNNGICPIYEPGLENLLNKNLHYNLIFYHDLSQVIRDSDIIFLAINTPTGEDGSADLTYLFNALDMIIPLISSEKILCIKSTVPVGTNKKAQDYLSAKISSNLFHLISIPEFLREGCAVEDFFNPDRIIIGLSDFKIKPYLKSLFSYYSEKKVPILFTDTNTSECIKYASNCFLATKIAYINDLTWFCERLDINISDLSKGIGLDKRIGKDFLNPGPGFGGSCFQKDIEAFLSLAKNNEIELPIIEATLNTNHSHQLKIMDRILKIIGQGLNLKVCIFGLAFKANTDDVRNSPAITIVNELSKHGINITGYDPKANSTFSQLKLNIDIVNDPYEAAANSDLIVILTEWQQFKELDYQLISSLMKTPRILDTRRILNSVKFRNVKCELFNLGTNYAS